MAVTVLGHTIPDRDDATPPGGAKDLLTVADLSRERIAHLFEVARALKASRRSRERGHPSAPSQSQSQSQSQWLAGMTLGLLFEKPSTRTRASFEAGMAQLGGHTLFLAADTIQLARGESLGDTALVLSRYLDGLVVRTFEQSTLDEWARHATIPVINGLTDLHHPCQALADLFTIEEHKGTLDGLTLAYVGDGNNIAHSLIEAGAHMGMRVVIGCPPGYQPDAAIVARGHAIAARHNVGAVIEITHDPDAAADQADVLYTDVWASMGREHEHAARVKTLSPYQLNARLLRRAKPSAIVLHCLPAHRGEEISAEVLDGPQSMVLAQAENRLHVQKAILTEWLGRPWT